MPCFNPRTRVGCDATDYDEQVAPFVFQSTHPRGVRPAGLLRLLLVLVVSIHAPAWGATTDNENKIIVALFQSTHPRGVRPARKDSPKRDARCFNPRTRVGCDSKLARLKSTLCKFQSTHPRGVRRRLCFAVCGQMTVSIHAPAWGATGKWWGMADGPSVFQSTHPRGVRLASRLIVSISNFWFQSTHPRGVRRPAVTPGAPAHQVSIHAPAWGATGAFNHLSIQDGVSIHAPAWGATAALSIGWTRLWSFNPRTRVGCDIYPEGTPAGISVFQSTHPRGVRLVAVVVPVAVLEEFQSTHPRGVRLVKSEARRKERSFNPRTRVGCDDKSG